MSRSVLSAGQLDCVLGEIATAAKQIDRLTTLLVLGCDQIDDVAWHDAMHSSITCLAQRIGWAADMAMTRSEKSIGPCFGDAADWMMPPSFHAEAGQLSQGNPMARCVNTDGRA